MSKYRDLCLAINAELNFGSFIDMKSKHNMRIKRRYDNINAISFLVRQICNTIQAPHTQASKYNLKYLDALKIVLILSNRMIFLRLDQGLSSLLQEYNILNEHQLEDNSLKPIKNKQFLNDLRCCYEIGRCRRVLLSFLTCQTAAIIDNFYKRDNFLMLFDKRFKRTIKHDALLKWLYKGNSKCLLKDINPEAFTKVAFKMIALLMRPEILPTGLMMKRNQQFQPVIRRKAVKGSQSIQNPINLY